MKHHVADVEVSYDALNDESKFMVDLWLSKSSKKPGTPEYEEMKKKFIKKALELGEMTNPDKRLVATTKHHTGNKMEKDDKVYSDEQKSNIGPDVSKWEKANQDDGIKVEKNHDGVVEKTMKSLEEKGTESSVPKVMASAPGQIRYKGALYVRSSNEAPNEGSPKAPFPTKEVSDWQKKQTTTNIDKVQYSENYDKTMDLLDDEAKKVAKYIKHNGSLYALAEDKKDPYSPTEVMAAEFGIPPEAVEDLKKYKDDSGMSILDLAYLAKSVNKKEK